MHRVDTKRFRDQAMRLLALARAARENGNVDFAAQLIQRAQHYLDMIDLAEKEKKKAKE